MAATAAEQERVVITGVSRGLGLAMANWFHKNGHLVLGCGRTASKISDLNQMLCSEGRKEQFSVVNVANNDEVKAWAKGIISEYGSPTMILNNAGVTNNNANLVDVPVHEFEQVVDVNIKGTVNVVRAFVPAMIEARKGVIVNFSSGWGRCVAPQVAPYCCTKWAIEGLSKAFALELPAPLVCVPLNPGCIDTAMLRTSFGETRAAHHRTPDEWARTACPYILSINRSEHNGQSVTPPYH